MDETTDIDVVETQNPSRDNTCKDCCGDGAIEMPCGYFEQCNNCKGTGYEENRDA